MGAAVGDYDGDGRADRFVTGFARSAAALSQPRRRPVLAPREAGGGEKLGSGEAGGELGGSGRAVRATSPPYPAPICLLLYICPICSLGHPLIHSLSHLRS